jgi:hypothetical protein
VGLFTERDEATECLKILKFLVLAMVVQLIGFSVLSSLYPMALIAAYVFFIAGVFYSVYVKSGFEASLMAIETKYRPVFESFATFEFIAPTGRYSRVRMHFRIEVGDGAQQPNVVYMYPGSQETMISVTIPQGVYGGQSIMVQQGLNGAQFSVQVPAGMQPGQVFNVVAPRQEQPVYAQENPMITATVVSVSDK